MQDQIHVLSMLLYYCKPNDIQRTLVVLLLKPFGERKEKVLTCKLFSLRAFPYSVKLGKLNDSKTHMFTANTSYSCVLCNQLRHNKVKTKTKQNI